MIVVDNDVDPFNEKEVFWTVATHVLPGDDVEILRKGGYTGPHVLYHKMLMPLGLSASLRLAGPMAPKDVKDRIKIEEREACHDVL